MDITKEKTDFGTIMYYKGKYFRFAMYIYDDDDETIYLSNVYVDPIARGTNLGNRILKLADQEAKNMEQIRFSLMYLKIHGYMDGTKDTDFRIMATTKKMKDISG